MVTPLPSHSPALKLQLALLCVFGDLAGLVVVVSLVPSLNTFIPPVHPRVVSHLLVSESQQKAQLLTVQNKTFFIACS